MKDVTFGTAREIAGDKAGMDDNSESGMLIFVPPDKGESDYLFSSAFLCTNSGSIFLFTYHYHSVFLGIQIPHRCLL